MNNRESNFGNNLRAVCMKNKMCYPSDFIIMTHRTQNRVPKGLVWNSVHDCWVKGNYL